jgi:hypothetical protein
MGVLDLLMKKEALELWWCTATQEASQPESSPGKVSARPYLKEKQKDLGCGSSGRQLA